MTDTNMFVHNGWKLTTSFADGLARMKDIEVGEGLKYGRPSDVRPLTRRLIKAGKLSNVMFVDEVSLDALGRARKERVFYYTQKQVAIVVMNSGTATANALSDEIAEVFVAYRNGQLGGMDAQQTVALLNELRGLRDDASEVRRLVHEQRAELAKLGPELMQKLLAEAPEAMRAVLVDIQREMKDKGAEALLRSKLKALFNAVTIARARATGKTRRSGLRWLQNKLQVTFGWGGKNQKIEDTPSELLSYVISFLQSELDDIRKTNPSAVDDMPPAPTPTNDQTNMFFLPAKTPGNKK